MFFKKKKGQVSLEVLIIIGVFLLGAIIFGLFYLSSLNKDVDSGNQSSLLEDFSDDYYSDENYTGGEGTIDSCLGDAHCSNSIIDCDEEALDCGGSDCPPCVLDLELNISPIKEKYYVNESFILIPNIFGGQRPYSCVWKQDGVTKSTDCEDLALSISVTGTYTLKLEVTDESGDFSQDSLTLEIIEDPSLFSVTIETPSNNDIFTQLDTVNFSSSNTSSTSLTYVWDSNIDGELSTEANFSQTLSQGTHLITLSAKDIDDVEDSDSIIITVNDLGIAFTSTWKTDEEGVGNDNQISLPLQEGGTYDFTVYWGDGTSDHITSWNQAEKLHTYDTNGTYEVNIAGTFEGLRFFDSTNPSLSHNKIQEISNWGSVSLLPDSSYAFADCEKLKFNVSEFLDTSNVTNMSYMFRNLNFNNCYRSQIYRNHSILDYLDVGNVLNMSGMFSDALFNCGGLPSNPYFNFNSWDVSKVTNMSHMFFNAKIYSSKNVFLNGWNVSKVTDMSHMFEGAYFQDLNLSNWNTSKVTDMSYMFADTFPGSGFLGDALSGWDVSKVITMSHMFSGFGYVGSINNGPSQLGGFNQPLNEWNVSSVIDMSYMFFEAVNFNQDLNKWDVSKVINMKGMFSGAVSFDGNISEWDVSEVGTMEYMFSKPVSIFYKDYPMQFNHSLNNWNVSKVTSMRGMFEYASSFNKPLDSWNVSNVINMESMFSGASSFNKPLDSWNVSKVTNMGYMFHDASSFNQDLSGWNVYKVTNMGGMFRGASSFNKPLDSWNVSKVTNMGGMFHDASSFNQDLSGWNVSKVTNMVGMFRGASSFNKPLDSWNVSKVTNMGGMFYDASSFNQDLSGWNVVSVNNYINYDMGTTSWLNEYKPNFN